jgi:hypothetical protein
MTQGTETGTPAHPALAAVEALTATLQLARALQDSGRPIDLAGLDAQAASLCTAVALLPAAVARPLRPALEALAREVDALSTALASH